MSAADFLRRYVHDGAGAGGDDPRSDSTCRRSRRGTSYQKMLQPASGFAIVGLAARVRRSGGKITMARVGITGLSNRAYRASAVEAALDGKTGSAGEIQNAAALAAEGVEANSDLFASADYRRHLAVIYTARALTAALARSA